DMDYFSFHHSTDRTFNTKFVDLFGAPRDPRANFFTPVSGYPSYFGDRPENFDALARDNQHYADIAASIQKVTEEVLLTMARAAWGEAHGPDATERFLRESGIRYERIEDEDKLITRVVDRPQSGKVVGWSQGRFEWGPRALGHRSILADPRRADMKDIVNTK